MAALKLVGHCRCGLSCVRERETEVEPGQGELMSAIELERASLSLEEEGGGTSGEQT